MKKIKYENTGEFTSTQKRLCEEIAERLKKLKKSGCDVIAKQNSLCVYKSKELKYSNLINRGKNYNYNYPIPCLFAGSISDSGSDDEEYFILEALDLD